MRDEKLWRREGPKALLEFLSSATGEDYDAAVYDTKFDFDPYNEEAVCYIASVAMAKAEPILMGWKKKEYRESFEYPMPTDGSIAPYDSDEGNESVRGLREERIYREAHAEGPCIYVPDASRYCEVVEDALNKREIPYDDMTELERKESIREKRWFEFRYHYLPMAIAILFACIGFFGIVIKLFS